MHAAASGTSNRAYDDPSSTVAPSIIPACDSGRPEDPAHAAVDPAVVELGVVPVGVVPVDPVDPVDEDDGDAVEDDPPEVGTGATHAARAGRMGMSGSVALLASSRRGRIAASLMASPRSAVGSGDQNLSQPTWVQM